MKPSVLQGLSDRPIEEGQERDTLNNEVRPVVSAIRAVVNYESRFKVVTDSVGQLAFSYKRIWESDEVPVAGTWLLEARVVGFDTSGDSVAYILRALFQISSSAITQVGATDSFSRESTISPDARFGIDSAARTIYVEAQSQQFSTDIMNWAAVVTVLEVT